MTINSNQDGKKLTVTLEGRLDTVTAPDLEAELNKYMDSIDELVIDFTGIEYISSAGLRVLLMAHKAMSPKGGMKICGVGDIVREVFDVTGFSDILTIE